MVVEEETLGVGGGGVGGTNHITPKCVFVG